MIPIVSFRGKIGAGKTTAAGILVERHGFERISLADTLKIEIYDLLADTAKGTRDPGLALFEEATRMRLDDVAAEKPPRQSDIDQEAKFAWIARRKETLRPLLQWWATEYRRAKDPDYWLRLWEERVSWALDEGRKITVDDARFDNEIARIVALGGFHVFIAMDEGRRLEHLAERAQGGRISGLDDHASEANANPQDKRNRYVVHNDATPRDLAEKIDVIMNEEQEAAA